MKQLVVGLVILLVLLAGYIFLSSNTNSPSVGKKLQVSDKQLLEGIAAKLEIKPQIQEYRYFDWIDNDNTRLPLIGQSFFVGTVDTNGIGKYQKFTDITQVTPDALKPIQEATTDYLTSLDFSQNAKNTRVTGLSPSQSLFSGYEDGETKCVIRLDVQTDPFGNFFCGKVDRDQLAKQQDFKQMFEELTAKEGNLSFRVDKTEGDFALGSATGDFMGYVWMAKKTGGQWDVVWRGNEIALCSDMTRLGIPQSIYGNCYQE